MSRQKKPYRFWTKPSGVIYVQFASMPNKWRSTGTKNKREADLWAKKHDIDTIECDQTFREFAEGFFIPGRHNWIERKHAKNKTFAADYLPTNQGRLDNYILPAFGDYLLGSIKPRLIDDWLINLKGLRKPLADASKNKILVVLRHVLQEAMEQGLIDKNPAKEIEQIRENKKKREPFSSEELAQLFPSSQEENNRIWLSKEWELFFRIEYIGGLRPGEVAALSWKDFYPNFKGLVVKSSVENRSYKIKGLKTEKNGATVKPVILNDYVVEELSKLKEKCKPDEDDLIFKSINGKVISADSSLKHFKASCIRAGVDRKDRPQYSLRHTFNTRLLRTLDDSIVQMLMGHTGYRPEYDHRTGTDLLEQLQELVPTFDKAL